ncbi:hypothetical protein VTK73DRAFT_3955 [Phialemonium thermophilum]|uniref:Uncharacterized protein n=1 Tax=Phialemonium thermophilum TaxID=223376 RepID=A0ABR3Y0K6_9PEZI
MKVTMDYLVFRAFDNGVKSFGRTLIFNLLFRCRLYNALLGHQLDAAWFFPEIFGRLESSMIALGFPMFNLSSAAKTTDVLLADHRQGRPAPFTGEKK